MLLLDSLPISAAVTHSGYFDEMAYEIGRYPNLLKENDVEVPGGLANFRNVEGICDDENVLEKWNELVSTSTSENGELIVIFVLPFTYKTYCI